jgi:ribonuclease BN (tRNA processing enzyme)
VQSDGGWQSSNGHAFCRENWYALLVSWSPCLLVSPPAGGVRRMKVVLLPCGAGARPRLHPLSTYLINDTVSVDAGGLGVASLRRQRRVRHVFLTHAHIDHIATLPVFLDTVHRSHPDGVQVYGLPATLAALQHDVFNDRIWPDFVRLSHEVAPPWLRLVPLTAGVPVAADGLRLTAEPVDHVVPTVAFLVEGPDGAVAIVTDTRPTEAIWRRAAASDLQGVFLEASFPEGLAELARISGHLTPSLFMAELTKVPAGVPVVATHLKPQHHARIARELRAYGNARVRVGRPGAAYRFPRRAAIG